MEKRQRYSFFNNINDPQNLFDVEVAREANKDDQLEAQRLANEVGQALVKRKSISSDGGVINYTFWKSRATAESTDGMIRARQAVYDADEMKRKSIFEDEYVIDYATGEKTIIRAGAAKLYEEAFSLWDEVLREHDEIIESPVFDDLIKTMKNYQDLLAFSGKSWPNDFVLQWAIDERASTGNRDGLPTSEDLAANRSDEDSDEAEMETPTTNESDDSDAEEPESNEVEDEDAADSEADDSADVDAVEDSAAVEDSDASGDADTSDE